MFAVVLKKILSFATIELHYFDGDIVHLKVSLGGKILIDKRIDIIKGA